MPASRPLVNVYHGGTGQVVGKPVPLPAVFTTPIRCDLVNFVHTNIAKNHRQPYAVFENSGHQTSAESWGTGRAVARIPRVPGGGTHRSGQGAFANMCRGGRLFAPTQIWRRWHRKVNVTLKRHALCAALAASAVPSLVMARGHRIDHIPEVPLVVSADTITKVTKTKDAVALLKKLHCYGDVMKVSQSKKIRAGKGKWRNRRYRMRRGPLVIFARRTPMVESFRNLPGVDLANVNRLNLLKLAPGGHLGRFVIWTQDAFQALDRIYGTYAKPSKMKRGYHLPRPVMLNTNLRRIMQSDNIQACLRPRKHNIRFGRKKNPLRSYRALVKLNPNVAVLRRRQILYQRMIANRKQHNAEHKDNVCKRRRMLKKTKPEEYKKVEEMIKKNHKKHNEKLKKRRAHIKAEFKAHGIRKTFKVPATKIQSIKTRMIHRRFNIRHKAQRKSFVKFLLA
eukprot:TRINITY_DN18780_c0_g1_i1.p1 TRINITY_DN18780_c0_g1~~TRINITY_DN18780_c0_g1_i1.p1  ORF type:complete len:462 (+),score=96.87 TRINITY_DN18780_c0_g1_i1:34-1386(+)